MLIIRQPSHPFARQSTIPSDSVGPAKAVVQQQDRPALLPPQLDEDSALEKKRLGEDSNTAPNETFQVPAPVAAEDPCAALRCHHLPQRTLPHEASAAHPPRAATLWPVL
jgi:hypothetical protein